MSSTAPSNPTSVSRTLKRHLVVSFFDVVSGEAAEPIAGESLLITVAERVGVSVMFVLLGLVTV